MSQFHVAGSIGPNVVPGQGCNEHAANQWLDKNGQELSLRDDHGIAKRP